MDMTSALSQFVGVLVGACLAWFGYWLKERKERRAALGMALADLLQVRHDLVAVEYVIQLIAKEAGPAIPSEVVPHLRTLLESFGEKKDQMNARYDRALALLAGVDPLTAFELKSKNIFPQFLNSVRQMSLTAGLNPIEMESLEAEVRKAVVPLHDAAVLRLARMYSWGTYRTVQEYLKREIGLPPEFAELLDKIRPPKADENKSAR